MIISFTSSYADRLEKPVPIKKVIPNWYKNMKIIIENANNNTIRKCQPVLDSMTMGYAILSPIDIEFTKNEAFGDNNYEIKVRPARLLDYETIHKVHTESEINVGVQHHSEIQISKTMIYDEEVPVAFKFLNPWVIKTPPGYSCLFTSPFNTERRDTRIITAVVDTDKYETFINFPFFLKDWDHHVSRKKVVKKGTPIALVFPFRRDDWEMKINNDPNLNKKISIWSWNYFSTLYDLYRSKVWTRKNYK